MALLHFESARSPVKDYRKEQYGTDQAYDHNVSVLPLLMAALLIPLAKLKDRIIGRKG
jgi:hypothetical protein